MGLDRLPSGSIRGRLMVDDVTCTATFATEAEAREWMVVTRGRAVGMRPSRTLTVEDYARRLGEFIDAAANIDRYRRDVEVHIVPALGPRPLGEICAAELETLLEQVSLAVSPADAEQVRRTLPGTVDRHRGRTPRRCESGTGTRVPVGPVNRPARRRPGHRVEPPAG